MRASRQTHDPDPLSGSQTETPAHGTLLLDLANRFSADSIRQRRQAQYLRSVSWMIAIRSASAMRRLSDALLAALLIVIFSPILLVLLATAKLAGGGLRKEPHLGRWAAHFSKYAFDFPSDSIFSPLRFLESAPSLFNILKGEMSFVGPRAASVHEIFHDERTAWRRYNLRPGLLSLWWLRKRANMAYASEVGLDAEYVETNTLWGDFGIALRAMPVVFLGGGSNIAPSELHFLGIQINNLTMAEASERIVTLARGTAPKQVCFVNADCVNIAFKDPNYKATLAQADLVLADGIGVRLAGTILNQNVRENINGTDMLPFLCASAEQEGVSLYLLGGQPGVAEDVAKWIRAEYPALTIAGLHHGYFKEHEHGGIIQAIRESGARVLLVALGAPRQDKWISAYKHELGVGVSIGVGGLFDFYSGRIPRAPVWLRELGLEWFYRFYCEPRRMWRRYFVGNAVFLFRVARERLAASGSHRAKGAAL